MKPWAQAFLVSTGLYTAQYAEAFNLEPFIPDHSFSSHLITDIKGEEKHCLFQRLPPELSMEEAIERMLCNDPQIRMTWAQAKAQTAQLGISRAAYLPRLDANIGRSKGRRSVDYDNTAAPSMNSNQQRFSNRLDMTWILYDFGQRNAAHLNAKHLLAAANANHDTTLQKSFASAANIYYEAVAANQRLSVSTEVLERANQNLKATEAKYRVGAAALSDYLQAKTALSQASLRRIRDFGAMRNAAGVLAIRMGIPPGTPLNLADHIAQRSSTHFLRSIEELLEQALQEHPAILHARALVEAAEAGASATKLSGMPTLALTANISRSQNRQSTDTNNGLRERDKSIGLEITFPVFDGFQKAYKTRSALAAIEVERAKLSDLEREIALATWINYQRLISYTQSLDQTIELVAQSRRSMEVVQGRYLAGVGNLLELINTLNAYTEAQEQHHEILKKWKVARLELAESLGQLGFWTINN